MSMQRNLPPTTKSVLVLPTDASLHIGDTLQLSASASDSTGVSTDVTALADWQSSNPAIATVNNAGLVTALQQGGVAISGVFSGIASSADVMVDVTLQVLNLQPGTATMTKGATAQFSVVGQFSDGSEADLTSAVTWLSSDNRVVTVDGEGLATAVGPGFATIGARTSTLAKVATINVPAPVVSVPTTNPCAALAQARAQMALLAGGQQIVVVETPQLGRVEYNRSSSASVGDLQRLIDQLSALCAESQGQIAMRRRPISVEGLP